MKEHGQNHNIERSIRTGKIPDQVRRMHINLQKRLSIDIHSDDEKTDEAIIKIIARNNRMAEILRSQEYLDINTQEKEMRGSCKVGLMFCVDGRIPGILIAGRAINFREEPAGLSGNHLAQDGSRLLDSPLFTGALHTSALERRDLLEIVIAHTSGTTDHGCGAMGLYRNAGLVHANETLVDANLRMIKDGVLPAVGNSYNRSRENAGLDPLQRVAIDAVYDTDTMGLAFYKNSNPVFSTTTFLHEILDGLQSTVAEHLGLYGSARSTFTDVDDFIGFSRNLLGVTKHIIETNRFSEKIKGFIDTSYPDLTDVQKQALVFFLARITALQYLTGLATVPQGGPDHHFANHKEGYLATSLDGRTVGRFDPGIQVFGNSPHNLASAAATANIELGIMDKGKRSDAPRILFVSTSVDRGMWEQNNEMINRAIIDNGQLFAALVTDSSINERVKSNRLRLVPVLIDQDTGEVLEVLDQTHLV